jgi:UrcA family protein
MFTRTLSALAAAGLTVATLALATPLHAAPADEEVVTVTIGDLDLASADGAARFDRRVRAAARSICGTMPADLNMQKQVADCQDEVIADARTELARAPAGGARYALALARRR